jgi:hypothetical protein
MEDEVEIHDGEGEDRIGHLLSAASVDAINREAATFTEVPTLPCVSAPSVAVAREESVG